MNRIYYYLYNFSKFKLEYIGYYTVMDDKMVLNITSYNPRSKKVTTSTKDIHYKNHCYTGVCYNIINSCIIHLGSSLYSVKKLSEEEIRLHNILTRGGDIKEFTYGDLISMIKNQTIYNTPYIDTMAVL